jgi:cytochrome c peroxidase
VDLGLAGFLATVPDLADPHYNIEETRGYHKVPTLRNVDKRPHADFVKAFAHNGYFKSLKEIVHFYNTRDVLPKCEDLAHPQPGINCWPESEVPETKDTERVGHLGLTEAEEEAIVAFLKTLSDGWVLPAAGR